MCGIAGLISRTPEGIISTMLASLEHRGRDDEGIWTSKPINEDKESICFGHRRLSIIDTSSGGHQPMLSDDGRYVVILNGEIYNYRDLRHQLSAKKHHFKTESDTEVLLAAWAEWGTECLPRLNGMFAFALWDNTERTLFLVRDRVGIKPLYYAAHTSGARLIFASEIKAILASRLVNAEINPQSLHQFLTFLWAPDPNTIFRGISTVPPGHFVKVRGEDLEIAQWWDIDFEHIEEGKDENWWRERLFETLDQVVKLEMVADVPLGSFLSGGVDSSMIVALLDKHSNGHGVSTYTIGIEAKDLRYDIIPDDAVWARQVGKLFNTHYHEIILKPDVCELLPRLIYHMDEPIADPAIIASYLVSQAARETLTVLLSGVGGDEVFAGYPRQLAAKVAGMLDPVPVALRRPVMNGIAYLAPGGLPGRLTAPLRNANKFARSAALDFEDRYLGFGTYYSDAMKEDLYTDELRTATQDFDAYVMHRKYFQRVHHAAPLNRLLYVDLKTFLPCLNLAYTDKMSMAANLEVRVPFLNHKILELAARMPPDLKLRGLKRKYILKRTAEKVLPRDIVWRKKAGFGAPIRSWLRGPLREMVADLLSKSTVKRRGLFRPDAVSRIVETNLSGREDYNLQVFQLLVLELWQRVFIDAN